MDAYAANIETALKTVREGHVGWRLHYYDEVTSTNDVAAKLIDCGAGEGEIVIADRQTAGRGRSGRSWDSPKGLNIYLSVILRPATTLQNAARITIMAGVAAAKALAQFSRVKPGLKWPNDIWIDGRKIAGILCEAASHGKCVVGIGINVNAVASDLSEDVRDIATSLKIAGRETIDRAKVIRRLCDELDTCYQGLQSEGFDRIKSEHDGSSIINGKKVSIRFNGVSILGVAKGIGDDGCLIVVSDDGVERHIIAGDVVVSAG